MMAAAVAEAAAQGSTASIWEHDGDSFTQQQQHQQQQRQSVDGSQQPGGDGSGYTAAAAADDSWSSVAGMVQATESSPASHLGSIVQRAQAFQHTAGQTVGGGEEHNWPWHRAHTESSTGTRPAFPKVEVVAVSNYTPQTTGSATFTDRVSQQDMLRFKHLQVAARNITFTPDRDKAIHASFGYFNSDKASLSTVTSVTGKNQSVELSVTVGSTLIQKSWPPTTSQPCDGIFCVNVWNSAWFNFSNDTMDNDGIVLPDQRNWTVLLLLLVAFAGVMGNILVCISIALEKKLQNITNYFLMSLAIADLLVSVIVMPCSIVHEIMGYWPFGLVFCDIWQVADVMMCTSSIMHMCTISVDRYFSIRDPLTTRNKSRTVVGIKIAVVWLTSLAIASPILFLGIFKPDNIMTPDKQCGIFDSNFVIYGSLAAFFVPLLLMLITYSLTIHLLSEQAKKCEANAKEAGLRRSLTRKSKEQTTHSRGKMSGDRPAVNGINFARKLQTNLDRHRAHPSEVEPLHSGLADTVDSSTSEDCPRSARARPARNGRRTGSTSSTTSSTLFDSKYSHGIRTRVHQLDRPTATGTYDNSGMDQHADSSHNDSNPGPEGKQETPPVNRDNYSGSTSCNPTVKPSDKFKHLVKKHSVTLKVAGILIQKRNENIHKEKLNSVRTERKAVKVLGTMFASFVICWAPFFSLNLAIGICESCDVDVLLFKVFLWLGYVSSTLNPIIYTIFNKTFKVTFIRILTCHYGRCARPYFNRSTRLIQRPILLATNKRASLRYKNQNAVDLQTLSETNV